MTLIELGDCYLREQMPTKPYTMQLAGKPRLYPVQLQLHLGLTYVIEANF
jgi:hypothetical protein